MVFNGATLILKVFKRRCVLPACLCLLASLGLTSAQALSLGSLTVLSNHEQPLLAEIPITEASELELKQVIASLADQSLHQKAAIQYTPTHGVMTVNVITKGSGQTVLMLKTEAVIPIPDLDFLLQVNWGAGQILKEYRLNLRKESANQAVV
jgi:pilus assembly protein FimV